MKLIISHLPLPSGFAAHSIDWITQRQVLFLLPLILLGACMSQKQVPILQNDLRERWLHGIPCSPPCWEGIVPGKTTPEEARTLLEKVPLVSRVRLGQVAGLENGGYVEWDWANDSLGGEARFDPRATPPVINRINSAIPTTYTLGEIMEYYGEPSAIIAVAGHEPDVGGPLFTRLQILFESHGFYLPVEVVPTQITVDTKTLSPIFFDSNRAIEDVLNTPATFITKWSGFNTFKFYCKDIELGKACESVKQ